MAGLTQAMCTSFKVQLLTGSHNFTTSASPAYKIALFKAGASIVGTYGAATTNYSNMTANSDELANGSGYTTGGNTLVNVTPTSSGTTAFVDFSDTSWSSATFTSRGALIYQATSGYAVCILDFVTDQVVSSGTFTIVFPTAGAGTAIIQIA
jgi:hypothetical protein